MSFSAPPIFIAMLFARVSIADIVLSVAEVTGGLIGALLWISLLAHLRLRVVVVAGLFVGLVVLRALEPFTSVTPPSLLGGFHLGTLFRVPSKGLFLHS
jgi:hypothetical protein